MMTDVIYLAPLCQGYERMWCEHDAPIDCDCIDGPHPWIKYVAALRQPTQSDPEDYELGKRDGYESAVQDIDMLTGGDGEYCYSTFGGERHCPDPDSMKARIAERFNNQPTQSDALREALETARDYVADVAVGNIHFNDNIKAMAAEDLTRIDAALQEQSK